MYIHTYIHTVYIFKCRPTFINANSIPTCQLNVSQVEFPWRFPWRFRRISPLRVLLRLRAHDRRTRRVSKLFATGEFWWYSESREEQVLLGSSLERNWGESEAKVRRNRNKPATRLTTKSRSKTVNIQIRVVPTRNNSTLYQPNIIFLFDECPFFVSSTYRFLLAYIYSVFYPDFLSIFIRSNNGQTNSVLIIEKKYEIIGKLERWSMCVRIGKSRSYWKIHRYER